jgi:hypothetical protein
MTLCEGPKAGAHEAMPEARWLWRRIYVFCTSAGAWLLLERIVRASPPEAALQVARSLMMLLALTMILYLVAPTAQQMSESLRVFLRTGRSQ